MDDCAVTRQLPQGANPPQAPILLLAADPEQLAANSERYYLKRLLAQGGLGKVWLAYDRVLGRDVALKQVKTDWLGIREIEEQFRREVLITGRLEHPGIVPVHDMGRYSDGRLFYCMKLVQGRTFREELRAFRELASGPERDEKRRLLFNAFAAMCNTVAFAHARGVLHLDLKPDNVVIGEFGETQVLDWGLAKLRIADPAEGRALSGPVGSPGYMAPEQIAGDETALRPETDVYALGVILTELAFADLGLELPKVRQLDVEEKFAKDLRATLRKAPRPIRAICLKAIADDPSVRYGDARDLAAEVDRWLTGERVLAYREGLWPKLRRFARKRKTPLAAGLAAAVVALVVLGAWTMERQRRRDRAADFASRSLDDAIADCRQGRLEPCLTRLQAAIDRLAADLADDPQLTELRDYHRALAAWHDFDVNLRTARFLSADTNRHAEALAAARQAADLGAVLLPDPFANRQLSNDRAAGIAELNVLKDWLQTGHLPEPGAQGSAAESDLYLAGRHHQLAGQLPQAMAAYKGCLHNKPEHFWAMYFLAVCQLQTGQVQQAVLGFTACLARQETLPELSLRFLFNNRGNACLAAGDDAAAEADFRRAAQLDARDPRPFHNLGISLVRRGDWAAAIEQFSKALAAEPGFAPSLLERARGQRKLGQLQLALADLDRLLTTASDDAAALAERSMVGLAAGRADEARRDAARAAALDPALSAPHFVAGCLAAAEKRWADAIAAYDRALAIDPKDPQLRNNRVAAYLNLARFQEAKAELDELLSRCPDYAAARLNRALASIGLHRFDGVLDDLTKVGPPRSEVEAVSYIESFATIALRAGEAVADESSRPVIALCFDRIAELLAQRDLKFRETAERLPALAILLRNPEAERRLRSGARP